MSMDREPTLKEIAEELRRKYYREYMKTWRERNKDKVKEYNAGYWLRRAEALELRSLDKVRE
jgi:ribosomal protein S17E